MIRKRKSKAGNVSYYVYHKEGEAWIYDGSAPTKAAAEEIEANFKLKRAKVRAGVLPAAVLTKVTIEQAVEQYLKAYRGRSRRSYESRFRSRLVPAFKGRLVRDIKQVDINELRDEMLRRHPATTVETTLRTFSALLEYCRERGWVAVNPVHGIVWPEIPERPYNWIKTTGEIRRLLAAANDDVLLTILAVAVFAGLRQDEILHLQWDDVDLDRRRIAIHRGRQGTTKGGKVRYSPILDSLLPLMKRWRRAQLGRGLLFPGEKGRVRSAAGVHLRYKRALARAGLDRTLRFHDLRHTFASHWVSEGGCLFKLNKILGHSKMEYTMRYAHLAPDAFDADYGRIKVELPMGEVLAFQPGNAFTRGRERNDEGEYLPAEGDVYRKPSDARIHSPEARRARLRAQREEAAADADPGSVPDPKGSKRDQRRDGVV